MKTRLLTFTLCIFFVFTLWAHSALERLSAPKPLPDLPKRIVSLAPSVTETLYALGLGPAIVGVTQFCLYPPEAADKPRVAGFSEIYYEAVVRAQPDMVVLPNDKISGRENLQQLGLSVLMLDTRSMYGLMNAIKTLGSSTGHAVEADRLLAKINDSLAIAKARAQGRPAPSVLFSVMHANQGLGYISEVNAVGQDGFYSEMIDIAGGENVYRGRLSFPRLSREAIIVLNPDVIIDVIPAHEDLAGVRRDWQSLTSVSAIKNNRLYLFTDPADSIPGPRFYQTLTKLSLALFPEGAAELSGGHNAAGE